VAEVLSRLARLAARRPRAILGGAFVAFVVAAAFGLSAPKHLTASDDDYQDKRSESFRTFQLIAQRTGVEPGPSIVVVGHAREAARLMRADAAVAYVRVHDGVAAAYLKQGTRSGEVARRFERTLPGLVGGAAVASEQVRSQSERDLFRAELIAFPLLLLLGIWIFRGLVAALLPVAAGLLSIASTLALLRLANTVEPISVFALNLVTGAGLGLAIDYSLLLVTRYREELARLGPGPDALRRTLETAGRTVAFSSITVAGALATLAVFPLGFLRSMGIAGGLVPSPSALIVLLASVGLGRTLFGVVLVLAYGAGMAATLTAVGLALVTMRGRLGRRSADVRGARLLRRFAVAAPVATAALVLVVGLALTARGLALGA